MVKGQIYFGIFICGLLTMMTAAAPVDDLSTELMAEPQNHTLVEEQDQEVNKTIEEVPSESSGDSSGELMNCTCIVFDCSNCGWKTNLLPNVTTPMAIIQLYNSTDETDDYLRKYFCKMATLKSTLQNNTYNVSY